jgi:hypothetical protein
MDKKGWLTSTNPQAMLEFLGNQASERKLRLFASACCRRVWDKLSEKRSRDAIEAAERYAEGLLDDAALTSAWLAASQMENPASRAKKNHPPPRCLASAAACAALPDAFEAAWECSLTVSWVEPAPRGAECRWQCSALRDLFGDPFQPVAISADLQRWNQGTISGLAQAAYDHRILPAGTLDPVRIAVLADAMEDACCSDETVLGHLREPGPHLWGCHILDALLGRQ